jgi:hypothetical protein
MTASLALAVLLTGCSARGVRVVDVKDNPSRYHERTVSLSGRVTTSWGFPLMPVHVYNVDDGTGEITVVARSGRSAPRSGTRVRVRGRISEIAVVGGRSIGLHVQEHDRQIRR